MPPPPKPPPPNPPPPKPPPPASASAGGAVGVGVNVPAFSEGKNVNWADTSWAAALAKKVLAASATGSHLNCRATSSDAMLADTSKPKINVTPCSDVGWLE